MCKDVSSRGHIYQKADNAHKYSFDFYSTSGITPADN